MINKNRGFTLLEILMVMGIIGILIAVSTVAFMSARKTSRDAKRKTDLEQIRGALETYKADNNYYPSDTSTPTASSGMASSVLTSPFLVNQYISSVPDDSDSTRQYYYVTATGGLGYYLCASLENGSATTASGCGSADCGSGKICNYSVANP